MNKNSIVIKNIDNERSDEINQNFLKSFKNEKLVNQNSIKRQAIIENKKTEQTEIIQSPNLSRKKHESEMSYIFDTRLYIVEKIKKDIEGIAKLSVQTSISDIKLSLVYHDSDKNSLDLLSTLLVEFEIDKDSNFIIVNSLKKNISPLNKGDLFTIFFEDESFIEKKFEVSRIHIGRLVRNMVRITDIELGELGQKKISHIEIFSRFKILYKFSDIENRQHLNTLEGKNLFQIICETINETKLILINSNQNITLSLKPFTALELNNDLPENNSCYVELEIAKIIQSLLHKKRINGMISNPEIKKGEIDRKSKKTQVIIENKINEQTDIIENHLLTKNNFDSKIEISNIFDTEASIVKKLSKEVGKITKISGQTGNGEMKFFLTLDDWKTFSIDFLPTLSIEFEVDNKYIFVTVNSSNKNISPLKKDDFFRFYFEDESFIEKKFQVGRSQSGKNVINTILLNDLELLKLSQNALNHLETFSGLKITYGFIEVENKQYSNSLEGKKLFQIMCQKLLEIKLRLKNSDINLALPHTVTLISDNLEIGNDQNLISSTSNLNESIIQSSSNNSTSKILNDESIIDVTDQSYRIDSSNIFKKYSCDVPYWAHRYVYSYSELNNVSVEQKKFYNFFKANFLSGEYFDLEGNTNYAFILMFDFLNEYDNHKNISILENQIKKLGQYYPKTKTYGISFLLKKMRENSFENDISRFTSENRNSNDLNYDTFNWRNKYKKSLNLTEEESNFLNKVWSPNNNFCNIEFCCLEVIKLYIALLSELKLKYESEGTTIDNEFSSVADVVARKQFKYRSGSQNYKYSIESILSTFYSNIFKYCENSVRELYGHKRKLNIDTYYTNEEVKSDFESKIVLKVLELLPTMISKVSPPDEATEIELYSQTTNRWKLKFEQLTTNYKSNPTAFVESIIELGRYNKKNHSVKNIFFEASKFIAKHDKISSLILYIYYLDYDLKSTTFDNKQLTKSIQKSLFKSNEQIQDFEQIVNDFIDDKELFKALNSVTKIYEVKRKKIRLDRTTIKDVQKLHSGTVELLNEYLRDDFEDEINVVQNQTINNEEGIVEIIHKNEGSQHAPFLAELSMNPIQISMLELFFINNFSILQSDIEEFAKSKGVFKNQVIESVNETCYEVLDDVLIEEEEDYYTIIPEYFQKISIK